MSELAELERRITDALDRIGSGLERLDGPGATAGPTPEEMAAMVEALDAEKTVNEQLEERLKALRRKDEARIKELEDEVDDLKAAAAEVTAQLQQARHDLEAAAAPVEDGEKQALVSELEGLRKTRDADRAELDAIVASLKPLLKEARNA